MSQLLLEMGADADMLDDTGRRAFEVAASSEYEDIIELLIENADQSPILVFNQRTRTINLESEVPLLADDSHSSTAFGFLAYGRYQEQRNESGKAISNFVLAKEHFELAVTELRTVMQNVDLEIPKAEQRRASQVAGGILLNVVGIALAGTTGTGFVATTGVTDDPIILNQRLTNYSKQLERYQALIAEIDSKDSDG